MVCYGSFMRTLPAIMSIKLGGLEKNKQSEKVPPTIVEGDLTEQRGSSMFVAVTRIETDALACL